MSADPAITGMILRAKIVASRVDGRTLVQSTVLDEDARDSVELLLPFGYVASPIVGADTLELQIGGYASQKVHLGGDHTEDALTDLLSGEAGLSRNGNQVMVRVTGVELVTALLKWGPARDALKRLVHEDFVALFNAHTHPIPSGGNTEPPNQHMTASQLTGGS